VLQAIFSRDVRLESSCHPEFGPQSLCSFPILSPLGPCGVYWQRPFEFLIILAYTTGTPFFPTQLLWDCPPAEPGWIPPPFFACPSQLRWLSRCLFLFSFPLPFLFSSSPTPTRHRKLSPPLNPPIQFFSKGGFVTIPPSLTLITIGTPDPNHLWFPPSPSCCTFFFSLGLLQCPVRLPPPNPHFLCPTVAFFSTRMPS